MTSWFPALSSCPATHSIGAAHARACTCLSEGLPHRSRSRCSLRQICSLRSPKKRRRGEKTGKDFVGWGWGNGGEVGVGVGGSVGRLSFLMCVAIPDFLAPPNHASIRVLDPNLPEFPPSSALSGLPISPLAERGRAFTTGYATPMRPRCIYIGAILARHPHPHHAPPSSSLYPPPPSAPCPPPPHTSAHLPWPLRGVCNVQPLRK